MDKLIIQELVYLNEIYSRIIQTWDNINNDNYDLNKSYFDLAESIDVYKNIIVFFIVLILFTFIVNLMLILCCILCRKNKLYLSKKKGTQGKLFSS